MTEFEETSKKIQDLVGEVFKQGIGVGYDHGLEVGTHNGYWRGYENGQKSKQTDNAISRQAGHWIPTYGNVKCSVCGSVKESRRVGKATHYCDFCGAKMVEYTKGEKE